MPCGAAPFGASGLTGAGARVDAAPARRSTSSRRRRGGGYFGHGGGPRVAQGREDAYDVGQLGDVLLEIRAEQALHAEHVERLEVGAQRRCVGRVERVQKVGEDRVRTADSLAGYW